MNVASSSKILSLASKTGKSSNAPTQNKEGSQFEPQNNSNKCLMCSFIHKEAWGQSFHTWAHTDLATCALVVEGSKSDGGEEDGNVEEDGCGHVLQQGFITANNTWGETNTSHSQLVMERRRLDTLIFKPTKNINRVHHSARRQYGTFVCLFKRFKKGLLSILFLNKQINCFCFVPSDSEQSSLLSKWWMTHSGIKH